MPVPHPRPLASTVAAFGLVAVFVLGGLVAPDLHRAQHAAEWAAERAHHVAEHHAAGGDAADVPCPPGVADLDCALCAGLSLAVQAAATVRADRTEPNATARQDARPATGEWADAARPRGPPVG